MTKTKRYRLYDLVVESDEPLSLEPLEDAALDGEPWRFEFGGVDATGGRLMHDVADFDGRRRLKVWLADDGIYFSHGDTRAKWNDGARTIIMERGDDFDTRPGIIVERVVAPISMMIRRAERVAMHASAVGGDGRAWIFAGDSGAGKSTTALALMRRGLDILADDLVLIDADTRRLMAAMPSVRLFDRPDEVPEAIDGELVMPRLQKYWYQLPARSSDVRFSSVEGVFSLEPAPEIDSPRIEPVEGRSATVRILRQAFDLTEADGQWRTGRFRTLCELARQLPVYRVVYARENRARPGQVDLIADALARRWGVELDEHRRVDEGESA